MNKLQEVITREKEGLDTLHRNRTTTPSKQEQHDFLTQAMQKAMVAVLDELDPSTASDDTEEICTTWFENRIETLRTQLTNNS